MRKTLLLAAAFALSGNVALAAELPCTVLEQTVEQGATDATSGGAVTKLQAFLVAAGLLTDAPTGFYGPVTVGALKSFQREHTILDTGAAGPVTRGAIKRLSCSPEELAGPATSTPVEPAVAPYDPALPPPVVAKEGEGVNPVKILSKKQRKTDDGFRTYRFDFSYRDKNPGITWWAVRVYCEGAVVRFGDGLTLGCGEETGRLNTSSDRDGAFSNFRLDAVADGRDRGRVTVRAWAFDKTGKIVGENRAYFWAH